jgi:molybdopterin-synthase adenylyltransferase
VNVSLTDAELARYARQLILPGLGAVTQEFLRAARVQVVGAGPTAGPALLYLAQAGIGTIFVDDAGDVAPEDGPAWLYPPGQLGEPRLIAAMEALKAASAFSRARAYATGADPTAVLVCAPWVSIAREAAERARVAGLPHVVARADGDGGEVVSVPPGAPCYSCAARPGTGAGPRPGASAAVATLGALELLLLLGGIAEEPRGRRVDLVLGQTHVRETTRIPGCPCGQRGYA